jgi:hypothetical protein
MPLTLKHIFTKKGGFIMKQVGLVALILLFAVLRSPAQVAEKTFSKSFHLDGKTSVQLTLPGTIEVKTWDNPVIRFEIAVSVPQGYGPMLNELANVGRYNLVAKADGSALIIEAPNLLKQIKIKGQEFKEVLNITVFVPKDVKVTLPESGMTALLKK